MTIGDFSRASRLSAKALRFYHRSGILEPAHVDDQNGYRLYAPEQIADAQIVRTLRRLDVPIGSIREVLDAPSIEGRSALLGAHLAHLEQKLDETQSAVQSLRAMLAAPSAPVEIAHRSIPQMRVAAISADIDLRDLGAWFRHAVGALSSLRAQLDPSMTVTYGGVWSNELFAHEHGAATLFLGLEPGVDRTAIDRVSASAAAAIVDLPAVEVAVAVHRGTDETVSLVYAALGEHVAKHELGIDAPVRETYLKGFPGIDRESETEIGWPIFRVSR